MTAPDRPLYPRIDPPEKQADGTYVVRVHRAPGDEDTAPAKTLAAARELVRFLERAAVLLIPRPKPPQRGHPGKLTPETREAICHCVRIGMPLVDACLASGIVYETLRIWRLKGQKTRGKYHDFFVALTRAEAEGMRSDLEAIEREPDWRAKAWRRERRSPKDFARIERHEVSGPDGSPMSVVTGEQALARLAKILAGPDDEPPAR